MRFQGTTFLVKAVRPAVVRPAVLPCCWTRKERGDVAVDIWLSSEGERGGQPPGEVELERALTKTEQTVAGGTRRSSPWRC